ncbi:MULTISPECIES: FliM/FliN family flagellar motor switch protein [Pseudescherichia]|jgi:flagellar motor switch protein FliM|uniref:FliM/FliN family flagellar motor switch protein n=1 Tax=Pseudescherichia TaxID=2055880 RepID=UPI000E92FE0D|nr:FliM/FliN family flagellar motor switch protein [Pseudescherichia sp.]WPO94402.1 FliM/FliN family flagellar motor switch protein [Buttiauxella sp. HR94]HAZ76922.1 hypothetical protein [Enterobacteriaceae bacterium]
MLKYSQNSTISKLDSHRLGRPYHRLPSLFVSKFDILESRIGNYFLKKHRSSLTLKKMACTVDIKNKNADLLASHIGHLAFDIDRPLLLTLLNNFYGLESEESASPQAALLPTKTEARLRIRLALDLCHILFHQETWGLPLSVKMDSSTIISQWACQVTFTLGDDAHSSFHILLDNAHTDCFLNMLRQRDRHQTDAGAPGRQNRNRAVVTKLIETLPLSLNVKIAGLSMDVASLTAIRAGDIFPLTLPDTFPVSIGQSSLFHGLIVEDNDKLYLTHITPTVPEKSYE